MTDEDMAGEIRRETVDRVIMTTTAGPEGQIKHSEDTGLCFIVPAQRTGGWHTMPAEGDEIEIVVNIKRKAEQQGG